MILGMAPWAIVGGVGGVSMTFITLGPVSSLAPSAVILGLF